MLFGLHAVAVAPVVGSMQAAAAAVSTPVIEIHSIVCLSFFRSSAEDEYISRLQSSLRQLAGTTICKEEDKNGYVHYNAPKFSQSLQELAWRDLLTDYDKRQGRLAKLKSQNMSLLEIFLREARNLLPIPCHLSLLEVLTQGLLDSSKQQRPGNYSSWKPSQKLLLQTMLNMMSPCRRLQGEFVNTLQTSAGQAALLSVSQIHVMLSLTKAQSRKFPHVANIELLSRLIIHADQHHFRQHQQQVGTNNERKRHRRRRLAFADVDVLHGDHVEESNNCYQTVKNKNRKEITSSATQSVHQHYPERDLLCDQY